MPMTAKKEEMCVSALVSEVEAGGGAKKRQGKCTSAYVIVISPVKQGKTLNKLSKKVSISSGRLTHEIAPT